MSKWSGASMVAFTSDGAQRIGSPFDPPWMGARCASTWQRVAVWSLPQVAAQRIGSPFNPVLDGGQVRHTWQLFIRTFGASDSDAP